MDAGRRRVGSYDRVLGVGTGDLATVVAIATERKKPGDGRHASDVDETGESPTSLGLPMEPPHRTAGVLGKHEIRVPPLTCS